MYAAQVARRAKQFDRGSYAGERVRIVDIDLDSGKSAALPKAGLRRPGSRREMDARDAASVEQPRVRIFVQAQDAGALERFIAADAVIYPGLIDQAGRQIHQGGFRKRDVG